MPPDAFPIVSAGFRYLLMNGVLRKSLPFVGGIAINDACNLKCRHCSVSGRGLPDMRFEDVRSGLKELAALGTRILYLEGGEPFQWRDGGRTADDIIDLARELKFLYSIIYTNGTFPLRTKADAVFVSIDGLRETHNSLRGNSYDLILSHIQSSAHPRIFINYTISAANVADLEAFCNAMSALSNVKGIYFYFFTPSGDHHELSIDAQEKAKIVERILALKRSGIRVLNSSAALRLMLSDRWKKPNTLSYLIADGKLYPCCRFHDTPVSCSQCGYLGFAELYLLSRFNLNAIFSALRYL